jgi:putative peptide zinc metalloprotease protein
VRAALLQEEIGLVREATQRVSIGFASEPLRWLAAQVVQGDVVASQQLPNPVLGTQGGGRIAVDATQPGGVQVKEQVFLVDLDVQDFMQSGHFGERAYVKFHHPAEPLAKRWYRQLQQVFIRHFS